MSEPFDLKPISIASIPRALEKAERYRLLNEPEQAESICLHILDADRDNQSALITLILALNDQFGRVGAPLGAQRAGDYLARLTDEYQRNYYGGIIRERQAWAYLRRGMSRAFAFDAFREALDRFEKAAAIRPDGDDEALLRSNACVRAIRRAGLQPRPEEPAEQVIALAGFLASISETGRCVLVTDLDDTLTAFFGSDLEDDTIQVLADYLAAGGGLVFNTGAPFDWFYQHVIKGLVTELGADLHVLRNVPLILSGGHEIYVFEEGAYRLVHRSHGRTKADGLDELVRLSEQTDVLPWNDLDPHRLIYLGDSYSVGGIDESMAGTLGIVINVGEPIFTLPGQFLNLVGGYRRAIDVFAIATAALKDSGRAKPPAPDAGINDAVLWTFADKRPPPGRRVRVRVGSSGYAHAGVAQPDGRWDAVYNVPLIPLSDGSWEALLPPRVNAFTFFWTEPPRSPGHPGHWERERQGGRVFTIAGGERGGIRTGADRGGSRG